MKTQSCATCFACRFRSRLQVVCGHSLAQPCSLRSSERRFCFGFRSDPLCDPAPANGPEVRKGNVWRQLDWEPPR